MYKRGIDGRITSGFLSLFHFNAYRNYLILSNPVNIDIEGSVLTVRGVRIKQVEFRGLKCKGFLHYEQFARFVPGERGIPY